MLFANPQDTGGSSSSSRGLISTTSPIKMGESVFLSSEPIRSSQDTSKNLLNSVTSSRSGQSHPIRKLSPRKKDQFSSQAPIQHPRKQTHHQGQAGGSPGNLRLVSNFSISQSIRQLKPLTPSQIQKVVLNYVYYIKDRQKTAEYQKLKRETPCLKIGIMTGSPGAKQMSVLCCTLIQVFSSRAQINPMAALDIVQMYLNDNYERYAKINVVDQLVKTGVLVQRNNELELNLDSPNVKLIFKNLEKLLAEQRGELLNIFTLAATRAFQLFDSKTEVQHACQNLWDSFMFYYMTSPLKHQNEMQEIVKILDTLAQALQGESNSQFIQSVLQISDQCLTKRYIDKGLLLQLIVKLLRLDIVNYQFKGVHIDSRQNVFNQKNKQVRNLLLKMSSYELLPFKVIIPSIDKSLDNRAGLIPVQPTSQVLNFGQSGNQEVLHGSYWLDWLELKLQQEMPETENEIIFYLQCLQNCIRDNVQTFWRSNHTLRFTHIKQFLMVAFQSHQKQEVFRIAELLIGSSSKCFAEQTYHLLLALGILTRDSMFELMNQDSINRPRVRGSASCTKYICKLITLDGSIYKTIQRDVFQGQRQGIIVTNLLRVLNDPAGQRIVVHVLRALSNLLVCSTTMTLQRMEEFEDKNYNHNCLGFLAIIQWEVDGNIELVKAACDHLNILIQTTQSVAILGERSQWLNAFRSFEPWKYYRRSFTLRCVTFLIRNWEADPNGFWNNTLMGINLMDVLDPILYHLVIRHQHQDQLQNEIVSDFLRNPDSPKKISRMELLAETLGMLDQALTSLQRRKVNSFTPGIPPILESILYKFVFNVGSDLPSGSQLEARKQIHPYLALTYLLCLPQRACRFIEQVTFINLSDMAIKILSRLMKIIQRKQGTSQTRSNILFDILSGKRFNPDFVRTSRDDKDKLFRSLRNKIKSRYSIDGIVQFMILLLNQEKLLLKQMTQTLKVQLLEMFIWICNNATLNSKNKLVILALKLVEQHKFYLEFVRYLASNSSFLVSLSVPLHFDQQYFGKSVIEEIARFTKGGRVDTKYLQEQLTRLVMVSNTSRLFLLLASSNIVALDRETTYKYFFQLYNQMTVYLLFHNEPNFNFALLQPKGKFYRGIPDQLSSNLNDDFLSIQCSHQSPEVLFRMIVDANSIAYSNWSKLFIALVNPSRSLDLTKQLVSLKDFDNSIRNFVASLVRQLNQSAIFHPVYAHYMIGLTVLLMGESSKSLVDIITQDVRWVCYNNVQTKQSLFFAIQAMSKSAQGNKEFQKVVEEMILAGKFISPMLSNMVGNKNNIVYLDNALDQLLISTNDVRTFVAACQYINVQINSMSGKARQHISPRIIETFCEAIHRFQVPLQQTIFYRKQVRNGQHMIWCWSLATIRNLVSTTRTNILQFNDLVLKRTAVIIRETSVSTKGVLLTRAFKDQLQLLAGYFASLLIHKHTQAISRSCDTVLALWQVFVTLLQQLKHLPITNYERSLQQTITTQPNAGLYSYRSVTPSMYSPLQGSVRSLSLSRLDSKAPPKNQYEVTASQILQELSTFEILLSLLSFIKLTLDRSPMYSKSYVQWQKFQECMSQTFNLIYQFFRKTYRIMGVRDLIKKLNIFLQTRTAYEDTGYLNTLRQTITIQTLTEIGRTNIQLISAIFVNHLDNLVEKARTQPIDQHLTALILRVQTLTESLVRQGGHLAANAKKLKAGLRSLSATIARNNEIIPGESAFMGSLMDRLYI